jgi:predicted Zn-dependent protease
VGDYRAVERLLQVRRHREAEEHLARELANNPGDPRGYYYLARLAYSQNDLAQAKLQVRECLARSPMDRDAQRLHALVLRYLDEPVEYEAALLELLRESPSDADALAHYARLLLGHLYLDEARDLLAAALKHDPSNREAGVVAILFAIVDGDRRGLAQALSRLLAAHPDSLYVIAQIHDAMLDMRRFFDAEHLSRQMVRMRPDSENLVRGLIELRTKTHPLAWPAYPWHRFGWRCFLVLGLLVALLLPVLPQSRAGLLPLGCLTWGFYSWAHTPLLRAWVRWRGV